MMRRIISTALAVVFTLCIPFSFVALAFDANPYADLVGSTINFYNWGEYISDGSGDSMDVIKEFTKQTGINVNIEYFDTNEAMYNVLKGGGVSYDVVVPSDYMIERLINEDMLAEIDVESIPNYKYIDEKYRNLSFDPSGRYYVPYNIGTFVLIYNTTVVDEKPDSWDILWDEQYANQILMFNNPRDAFSIAQARLGLDVNSHDPATWQLAAQALKEQKPLVKRYVMDEVFDMMEKGEGAIAPYYAGDFEIMRKNNPDLDFAYPKEGTNVFVDGFCVPKNAKNKQGAEAFINFLHEPEVALENAMTIGYATPNTQVLKMENYTLRTSEAIYPNFEEITTFEFHNLPAETLSTMTTLWGNVKESDSSGTFVYVVTAIIAVGTVVGFITHKTRKKYRASFQNI